MYFNITTADISPLNRQDGPPVFYILIPFVGFTLIGCIVALAVYLRRKMRLDDLRHKLIPLYRYNPDDQDQGSEEDWEVARRDEEDELMEPLYRDAVLSFTSGY